MFLDYLKESPDCLYIYNRDFSIYGLKPKEHYTVVVKDEWICPEEFEDYDPEVFEIYKLSEWFGIVLNGDLVGWECACLNKKYVIKEHVKLLMTTNPLQLRKSIDAEYRKFYISDSHFISDAKQLVRGIKFAVQIILNHKIVNYKDGLTDCNALDDSEDINECYQIIDESYNQLKSLTDGVLEKDRMNNLKKKWAKS